LTFTQKNKKRKENSPENEPIGYYFPPLPFLLLLFRTHGLVSNKGTIYLLRHDTIDVKYWQEIVDSRRQHQSRFT